MYKLTNLNQAYRTNGNSFRRKSNLLSPPSPPLGWWGGKCIMQSSKLVAPAWYLIRWDNIRNKTEMDTSQWDKPLEEKCAKGKTESESERVRGSLEILYVISKSIKAQNYSNDRTCVINVPRRLPAFACSGTVPVVVRCHMSVWRLTSSSSR